MRDNSLTSQERRKKREQELCQNLETKATRRIKARREKDRSIWFGLGMFGLVGWSVAVPTLVGIALGVWIDARWPSRFSWTLMLLFVGVALGCINAWRWVKREGRND
jgi:ATP synthase protein I